MKKQPAFLYCCIVPTIMILLFGCESTKRAEIDEHGTEVRHAKAGADQARSTDTANLVHCVWFKLKEEIDESKKQELIDEILKLQQIEQVNGLEIGDFHDLSDPRAMSEYQLYMQMRFQSDEDYHKYQNDPVHLQLKEFVKQYLAGPPATYDYRVR